MGSRYLFIALYCWLEKYFSRGDYQRIFQDDRKRVPDGSVEPPEVTAPKAEATKSNT